jgi:hypothetical protein
MRDAGAALVYAIAAAPVLGGCQCETSDPELVAFQREEIAAVSGVHGRSEARRGEELGHAPTVFERSCAKVYEDAQDMEEMRTRLASIGCGVRSVD